MKLLNLEIQNINSHENTIIDFSEKTFVSFVGTNGSGKSSIIESVMFALFGDNRFKLDAIVKHGASEAKVKIVFQIDDNIYSVIRVREIKKKTGVSKLFVSKNGEHIGDPNGGLETNQAAINDILGFSEKMLKRTVFSVEGDNSDFMLLSPSERKDFIIDVLGLDEYETYLSVAKTTHKKLYEQIIEIEKEIFGLERLVEENKERKTELTELNQRLEKNKTVLKDLNVQQKKFIEFQNDFIIYNERLDAYNKTQAEHERLTVQYNKVCERINQLSKEKSEVATGDVEEMKVNKEIFEDTLEENLKLLSEIEFKEKQKESEMSVLKADIARLNNNSKNAKDQQDGVCDACGSVLTESHIQKIDADVNEKKRAFTIVEKEMVVIHESKQELQESISEERNTLHSIASKIEAVNSASKFVSSLKSQLQSAEQDKQDILVMLEDLNIPEFDLERPEEYPDMSSDIKLNETETAHLLGKIDILNKHFDSHADCEEKLEEKQNFLEETINHKYLYETIIEGCHRDGIPSIILDSMITEFENNINYALKLITDGLYSAEVDYSQGFQVSITINGTYVNYESASLGEKTRINQAIRLALYLMVKHKTGKRIDTFVIDEGIGALDSSGLDSIMSALLKLNEEFPLIILIAHQEAAFESSPQSISVEKINGSSVLKEVRL